MAAKKKKSSSANGKGEPKVTPAMRQFFHFKQKYPECILFFRMGDFYEMFYEDAKLAHRVLGVTLTQRSEGVPMAGVPFHSVEGYLRRTIQAGYRVAICDQVEDPKEAKGVVRREVTRIVTPGTLTDDYLLEETKSHPLAAIHFHYPSDQQDPESATAHIAWVDLSTGTFEFAGLQAASAMEELARIHPSEILFNEENLARHAPHGEVSAAEIDLDRAGAWLQAQVMSFNPSLSPRSELDYDFQSAHRLLKEQYHVKTLQGFGIVPEESPVDAGCVQAMGAILRYLKETQFTYTAEKAPNPDPDAGPDAGSGTDSGFDSGKAQAHLLPPRRFARDHHLVIDETSLRSLEIEVTARSGETDHSLVSTFLRGGSCKTAMGKRLLRQWLCYPLNEKSAIDQRLNYVDAILQDEMFRSELRDILDQMHDLPRIATRVAMNRATPRDLVALGRSSHCAQAFHQVLSSHDVFKSQASDFASSLSDLEKLADILQQACIDTPPAHMREGGLIADGFDQELDEYRLLQRDSQSWLAEYQAKLAASIGLNTLKVGYNKVFGYYIELSAAQKDKAPEDWIRKQTLKNAERYITQELKTFEGKVLSAKERAVQREQRLFQDLCLVCQDTLESLRQLADLAATLDVLQCFATRAKKFHYTKPMITNQNILQIDGGRHPVLDETLQENFVPNDILLGHMDGETDLATNAKASFALITGPNMAGKSTFIRQAALLTLLAHAGSFVPAEKATIGLCDRIFTRIGASDELHSGQSTFMVEMVETARICNEATQKSLVILDEIGRGTSTYDGLSLAWSITEHLAQLGARTLFATHYHELTELGIEDNLGSKEGRQRIKHAPVSWPNICNLYVSVREWQGDIVFMHQIVPGATNRSYGIHVAKIAGLPASILARAKVILSQLERESQTGSAKETREPDDGSEKTQQIPADVQPAPAPQMTLFASEEHVAVKTLRELQMEQLTPLAAFDLIRALKEQL